MLLRPRGLLDVVVDPGEASNAIVRMLPRMLPQMGPKAVSTAPGVARTYIVDWEFAWFFTLPIEHLLPFVPRGMRAYQPDPERRLGLMHMGYIRMRPGNLGNDERRGVPAFEELTWGVQAQPFERDWKLPYTFVANRLAGNNRVFREISRDEDHYPIYDTDDITFDVDDKAYSVSVAADGKPICDLRLGNTKVDVDSYALLPVPAEIIKPGEGDTLYRNTFNFLGLVMRLGPTFSRDANGVGSFTLSGLDMNARPKLYDHPFFDGLFSDPAAVPTPYAVMMSRPGTLAAQVLTATQRVR